jgi:hypothetical protein
MSPMGSPITRMANLILRLTRSLALARVILVSLLFHPPERPDRQSESGGPRRPPAARSPGPPPRPAVKYYFRIFCARVYRNCTGHVEVAGIVRPAESRAGYLEHLRKLDASPGEVEELPTFLLALFRPRIRRGLVVNPIVDLLLQLL